VKLMLMATREVAPDPRKTREEIKGEVEAKSAATEELVRLYASDKLRAEDIQRCISSIADNNSWIALDRYPVDRMLRLLTEHFSPSKGVSLAIKYGYGGSRLSHDHATQFAFVLQSLLLWREVINQMFKLWFMTEADLLSETSRYQLRDTGQGLNRLQPAPNVGGTMSSILHKTHAQVQRWVGLSVVHLGDRDVPNALIFIDKYTQVSRILGPIGQCVDRLDALDTEPQIHEMFESLGGVDHLKKSILQDFFKHGFDGSGSDGGSCIDGRLTSSWNWCSKLEKKGYYPLFLLTGFMGFDGSYRK